MVIADSGTAADLLTRDHERSFAYRAARLYRIGGLEISHEPGTRGDFLQALHLLGAKAGTGARPALGGTRLILPVHISCSRENWIEVFGEPDYIEDVSASASKNSLYLWKHYCSDGPITCNGHLFDRRPGMPWVVAVRISLL